MFIIHTLFLLTTISANTQDDVLVNNENQINVIEFCRRAAPKLENILLNDNSFVEKKREFYVDVLETLVPAQKKAVISLINQLIHVFGKIPDNFKKLGNRIYERFGEGSYKFDEETLRKIKIEFDEEYKRGNMMQMWNSKNDLDRTLPYFHKLFYLPFDVEEYESTSDAEKIFINVLEYIFEGKSKAVKKEEL